MVEKEWIEAACMDGAGKRSIFLHIQLPVLIPYLAVGIVFLIMQFFGIYRNVYMLFDTDYLPEEVYLIQHYLQHHYVRLDYPYLAAASLLFTFLLVAVIVAAALLLGYGKGRRRRFLKNMEAEWNLHC